MPSAAFLTYNNVRSPRTRELVKSGWYEEHDRRALVLTYDKSNTQVEAGMRLALWRYSTEHSAATIATAGERIDDLWPRLTEVVSTLDHVVIYLGVHGTEHAIEMAKKLSIDRLLFMMCDCDIPWKRRLLTQAGLQGAKTIVVQECGGDFSMYQLFRAFLETGELRLPT